MNSLRSGVNAFTLGGLLLAFSIPITSWASESACIPEHRLAHVAEQLNEIAASKLAALKPLHIPGIRAPFLSHAIAGRIDLLPVDAEKALEIAKKYGFKRSRVDSSIELVYGFYESLAHDSHGAIEKAQVMAKFCEELEPLIKNLPKAARKEVQYLMTDAVLSLESWKPEEFDRSNPKHPLVNSGVAFLHPSDYPKYIEGYIHGRAPYTTHKFRSGGGILNFRDMRDAAAHNMWPLELDGHDIRHPHYALGHPRAMAVYFKAARSKKDLRFTMMAAMYEGVDTLQYFHETKLAKYMSETKGMDLEEAMTFIGRATDAELANILEHVGIKKDIANFSRRISNWKPSQTEQHSKFGKASVDLDADLDAMVVEFDRINGQPELKPYTHYKREPGSKDDVEASPDQIWYPGRQ